MLKKSLSLLLVLVMVLAILPALPAQAAGASPWTGVWKDQNDRPYAIWQNGDKIVGAYGYGMRLTGTLSGNELTGSITEGEKEANNCKLTISADGKTITGYWLRYVSKPDLKQEMTLTKVADYSEITPTYTSGTAVSFTGLWDVHFNNWRGMIISQDGDKVTGYTAYDGGRFEGTVSGNVLTATYDKDAHEPGKMITMTMSSDGKSLENVKYWTNSAYVHVAGLGTGERLSDITYQPAVINASDWAKPELQKADALGLIPDSLKGQDLKKNITRAEFAAVAVKVYENLAGKTATPAATNPFTDTKDPEVLKAYNVGITSGTAADKFSPDVLLNREQCATMLTRVLKRCYIPGWTLATDGNFTLNFTQPAKFADDAKISDWAKPSVYFMAANGVISGTGNNNFSPRATTTAEQAANYASATREQAIIIGVRMVEKLGGKPLDYKESAAQQPTGALTLDTVKANATAAGHEVDINYAAMSSTGYPKKVGGFSLIYKKDHKYDNVLVLEFGSAADATAYGTRRLEDVSRAVIRVYDKFYLEALMNDKSVSFTDDMAKQVMKDLFKNEGTAVQAAGAQQPTQPSGSIDSKIVGAWSCTVSNRSYVYQFNSDGTFAQSTVFSGVTNSVTGKYTTSNGTVYLTGLVLSYSLGSEGVKQESLKDKSSEYSLGFSTEYNKDYLSIRVFSTNDNNPDSDLLYKFYK